MRNLTILLLLLGLTYGNAQQLKITGTVVDFQDYPLPGVNVTVEGTNLATQTDFDGYYTIQANKGQTLLFTYIGHKDVRVKIGDKTVINVIMEEDFQALEEVVVTAMGIKREKKVLGYAVSMVQADAIAALSGRAAGVNISRSTRGSRNKKKIRGVAAVDDSDAPLYIVDGVAIAKANNTIVSKIPKDKIAKLQVHKKKKAKQLYGASARHGCIVISTKKGNYQVENDEAYAKINENRFQHVTLDPLSTFSIDVDKASYSNIRRMINNGQDIPFSAVKVEEMINYFDYDYPQPKDHPFAIHTEVAETPWNKDSKLVRIGLQGKTYDTAALPPSNLTFLIDVSGSMDSPNKLPLLKSAFKLLVNQLREKDKVAIVVYAGAAGVVLEPTPGHKKKEILAALDNLQAGGSTAGGEGIQLAYQLAQQHFRSKGNNRVILATDGDFNVGPSSDDDMATLIEEKRKSGVFLSVLGFGMGNYKDSKLEKLADKGNGNHAYIDTMQEAQKVFGKEFGGTLYTIAKDVKIQVEFNPNLVQAYRLIGYENRLLADADFIDDTKDAGELGSGHTVTALYEVLPQGVESPYLKDVHGLKYTKSVTENTEELLTVKFRYKQPDGHKSKEIAHVVANETVALSKDFSFTAAVALFGLQLRNSQFIKGAEDETIIALAEQGLANDKDGYRSEFIRLVKSHTNRL